MKKLTITCLVTGLLLAMLASQGCAVAVVGGAAAVGYSYSANTLEANRDVSLERAWQAANGALRELEIPVTNSKQDGLNWRLEGRNLQDEKVVIKLQGHENGITKIKISVGTLRSQQKRAAARLIYEKMAARL